MAVILLSISFMRSLSGARQCLLLNICIGIEIFFDTKRVVSKQHLKIQSIDMWIRQVSLLCDINQVTYLTSDGRVCRTAEGVCFGISEHVGKAVEVAAFDDEIADGGF